MQGGSALGTSAANSYVFVGQRWNTIALSGQDNVRMRRRASSQQSCGAPKHRRLDKNI
jgi:hypothetical protein